MIPTYVNKIYTNKISLRMMESKFFLWLVTLGEQPRLKNVIVKKIENLHPNKILQLGCVPGNLSKKIAQVISANDVLTIIDVSPNALTLNKNKLKNFKNVQLKNFNAEHIDFPDANFDVIICFFLLHEVPLNVKKNILKEAFRLLKPNGNLFIADYHKTSNGIISGLAEKIIRKVEPFSGELMDFDLLTFLKELNFSITDKQFGKFSLYQFIEAKK